MASKKKFTLGQREREALKQMVQMEKELNGLYEQRNNGEQQLKALRKKIKDFKSNRKKSCFVQFGGNMMEKLSNKQTIVMLVDRRNQLETAINSVKQQIEHREDTYIEYLLKMYKYCKRNIPKDILEDIEE